MRHERGIVILLCVFAAVRVLSLALAFPPFNPIDEIVHFDVILKYARGDVPRGLGRITSEATELYVLYGWGASTSTTGALALQQEPEYREQSPGRDSRVPVWTLPPAPRAWAVRFLESSEKWKRARNQEDTQPPLYYALAAAWDRIGAALGVHGPHRLYWIRLLNVPLAALVVWLGWRVALRCWPLGPTSVRLGVPVLLAALPQDCLYGITNDALSPVVCGAAFSLLAAMTVGPLAWPGALSAGLLTAAAVLTKAMNLVMIVPLSVAAAASIRRLHRTGCRAEAVSLAVLVGAAALPVASWWTRNWVVSGDLTGGRLAYRAFGWSLKTVSELTDHPVFHSSALARPFWHDLMATYWRGEYPWHGVTMSFTALDVWSSSTSALFLALAASIAWRARAHAAGALLGLGLATFVTAVGVLLALSVVFQFSELESMRPSPGYPFFSNGRLIGGTLVPFATLYLAGLGAVTRRPLVVVIALALALTVAEFVLSVDVFRSGYNWFHLVAAAPAL